MIQMSHLFVTLLLAPLFISNMLFANEQELWKKEEAALIKKVKQLEEEVEAVKIENTANKKVDISSRFNTRETQRSSYTQVSTLESSYNDINKTQKTFKTYSNLKKDRFGKSIIFTLFNTKEITNFVSKETLFSIQGSCVISTISNYHKKQKEETKVGTIGLRASTKRMYGPWQAKQTDALGKNNVQYKTVTPHVTLPPGTYTIIDSDKNSWSSNIQSGKRGMSHVYGTCKITQK